MKAVVCLIALVGIADGLAGQESETPRSSSLTATLSRVDRIWDAAPHNAFTDLVRWRDHFYCAFREGQGHAGDVGRLRILRSKDGAEWTSAAALTMDDVDLRDADLSVTPDGRLLVLGGAQRNAATGRRTGSFASFSEDGHEFTEPRMVVPFGRWLWRITWHGDTAFGVTYPTPDGGPHSSLVTSVDGLAYDVRVPELFSVGRPTEAVLQFDDAGEAFCIHRRDGSPSTAMFGRASPPYRDWEWQDLGVRLGGPNLLQLPTGEWLVAGRRYDGRVRTSLHHLNPENGTLTELLVAPSGGDTSYPGLVWHDEQLWMSYYSSHESRTSIYLARIGVARGDSGRR